MDKEQKQRIEELKRQAQINIQKQKLQKNVLLQECWSALNSYRFIDDNEVKQIIDIVSMSNAELYSHDDLIVLGDEEQYYIVWDEASLPVVLCLGKYINEFWDDVVAVAFDTYFVAESTRKVIGIRH